MKLRKTTRRDYNGYILREYSESFLSLEEIKKLYTCLQTVPSKISSFVERSTIKDVYKHDNWTYFVVDMDGKIFELTY